VTKHKRSLLQCVNLTLHRFRVSFQRSTVQTGNHYVETESLDIPQNRGGMRYEE